jgi:hypothetical protein
MSAAAPWRLGVSAIRCSWNGLYWQAPFTQVCPCAHALPHAPQFVALVERSTHRLLQGHNGVGHAAHWPCWQPCVFAQPVLHAPQLVGSLFKSTQLPLHAVSGAVHVVPQVVSGHGSHPDGPQSISPGHEQLKPYLPSSSSDHAPPLPSQSDSDIGSSA